MNVTITPEAKEELINKKFDESNYTVIQAVGFGWGGPSLAVMARETLNEDHYEIKEADGFKVAVAKNIADAYTNFTIDYVKKGFFKVFEVDYSF